RGKGARPCRRLPPQASSGFATCVRADFANFIRAVDGGHTRPATRFARIKRRTRTPPVARAPREKTGACPGFLPPLQEKQVPVPDSCRHRSRNSLDSESSSPPIDRNAMIDEPP